VDPKTLVASDSTNHLYRIGIGNQLSLQGEKTFENAFTHRLASMGSVVATIARGTFGDALEVYRTQDLEKVGGFETEGAVLWGPYAIGNAFLVLNDRGELIAVNDTGSKVWSVSLGTTRLVGIPVLMGDELVLVSGKGTVFRVASGNGELLGRQSLREPVVYSPLIAGKAMIVPGEEGMLLATRVPDRLEEVAEDPAVPGTGNQP
jgi:outer membrane protein assembly factor BamB